jgi:hypothetical protein
MIENEDDDENEDEEEDEEEDDWGGSYTALSGRGESLRCTKIHFLSSFLIR